VSPTKRGGIFYLYVPRQSGGVALRTTGTGDARVMRGMKRMLSELKDARRWPLLDAILSGRLTLGTVYDAHTGNTLDTLEASLSATALALHVPGYLARLRALGRSARHVGNIDRQLRAFLHHVPDATTASLTRGVLSGWLAQLTRTPGTRRQYLYGLTGFTRYLCDVGVLAVYPFTGIKAPKKNAARMRYESEANDRRIVAAAKPKYRAMLAFIKATGCDASTPLRTLRRHLDLENGVAEIQGTKTPTRLVQEGVIEAWALPILREYCANVLPNAHLWPEGKGKPGAHGTAETPWFTANGVGKEHAAACRALKIDGYTLKDSRHSVAVRMARAGYTSFEIGEQIGTSAYVVAKVYARFLVKMERRVTAHVTSPAEAAKR
jgi:integrase